MTELVQRSVSFYGDDLVVIKQGATDYTPVKPVCDILGIDWESQRQRIARDEVLGSVACVIQATGADGKRYEMICLPLDFLNGWLFGVSADRIKLENRENLKRYKLECYRVLSRAFGGEVVPSTQLAALEARVAALEAKGAQLLVQGTQLYVDGQQDRTPGRELFDKVLVLLNQCEIVDNADRSWQWLHYERGMVAARRIGEPSWRVLSTSPHWKAVVGCNAVNMFGAAWLAHGLICPHRPSRPISDRVYTGPGKGNHQCILVPDKHLDRKA